MHEMTAGCAGRGEVPGIVTAVSRRGEVHVDAIGTQAASGGPPMQRDNACRDFWTYAYQAIED